MRRCGTTQSIQDIQARRTRVDARGRRDLHPQRDFVRTVRTGRGTHVKKLLLIGRGGGNRKRTIPPHAARAFLDLCVMRSSTVWRPVLRRTISIGIMRPYPKVTPYDCGGGRPRIIKHVEIMDVSI